MPFHLALGLAVGLSACSDPSPGSGTGGGDDDEVDALRLGRVHVVLATAEDDTPDGFELTARFAMVRGLEEEFVRARADMPDLAIDLLSPGQCASESSLWSSELTADSVDPSDAGQELLLVDAGELEVQLGEARLEVPLALAPDLLPYMSGVEYAYFAEDAEVADLLEADRLTVMAAGGLTDDLPAFTADSVVPGPISLQYTAEDLASIDKGALAFRWSGQPSDDPEATLTLRFTPLLDGEPLGDDIVCLAADRGQTRFDLAVLRTLGFAPDADGVRVQASRIETSLFDVGAWAGTELVVERLDVAELPLR